MENNNTNNNNTNMELDDDDDLEPPQRKQPQMMEIPKVWAYGGNTLIPKSKYGYIMDQSSYPYFRAPENDNLLN